MADGEKVLSHHLFFSISKEMYMIDNILDRKIENEINLFEIELDNYCENAIKEISEDDQLYTEGSGDILGKIKEKIELIFQKIANLFAESIEAERL